MSAVIKVADLHKSFKRYKTPWARLKELITRRPNHTRHTALEDISFTVEPGETLGVLGCNGAGKSTLLKLINGVLLPESGTIECTGKITGLLELGTGFDPSLTGRQNIINNGLLIGMEHAEIEAARDDIIAFSELKDAIDDPVRTYSSGMTMRLAFSIAIHANPACFLVDEALSVGDGHFQQKCIRRIRQFKQEGGAIIFVSHDLNAVKMLCDRAIVLDGGRVALSGSAEQAVNMYNQLMADLDENLFQSDEEGFGSAEAVIDRVAITGQLSGSDIVASGETADIDITLRAKKAFTDLTLGIMIRDRFGQDIFGTNTYHKGYSVSLSEDEELTLRFTINLDIAPGKYTLTSALHSQDDHISDCYHWVDNALSFEVAGFVEEIYSGVCRLPVKITSL
ncbi:ABC transporter ATP-binding protein [Neptuniibacter sp.]|uniref:ABC transporter ATP-binding protein n=1 Tax=Neptuniibacter sp. TaxID=1962643 RepID=UPI0026050C15|nr:ABC transporter ATP-binding protein [Neptuniibacter sp.]MCP4598627.1 ABC transporter ATP-binding protein [Neptuniibacter sp.]